MNMHVTGHLSGSSENAAASILHSKLDAVRKMLEKHHYDAASIEQFLPKLLPVFENEALKQASPSDCKSYIEHLLKKAAKDKSNGAIPLRFTQSLVALESLDVSKLVTMATPPAPNPLRIAQEEENIKKLRDKAKNHTVALAKPSLSVRTTQDKIVIGMNAIAAALFIGDGIRRYLNSEKSVDENGKTTLNVGAMVVPALQVLLGVGCAYLAHNHYTQTGAVSSVSAGR